jgi:hypothetical protein
VHEAMTGHVYNGQDCWRPGLCQPASLHQHAGLCHHARERAEEALTTPSCKSASSCDMIQKGGLMSIQA